MQVPTIKAHKFVACYLSIIRLYWILLHLRIRLLH